MFFYPGPRLLRWMGIDIWDTYSYGVETVDMNHGVEQYYACLR